MRDRDQLPEFGRSAKVATIIVAASAVLGAAIMVFSYPVSLRVVVFKLGPQNLCGWASLPIMLFGVIVYIMARSGTVSLASISSGFRRDSEFCYGVIGCQYLFFLLTAGVWDLADSGSPFTVLHDTAMIGATMVCKLVVHAGISIFLVALVALHSGRRPRAGVWIIALTASLVDVLLIHLLILNRFIHQ